MLGYSTIDGDFTAHLLGDGTGGYAQLSRECRSPALVYAGGSKSLPSLLLC